jgi:predicted SAM-dependent methyltransferase
MTNHAGEQDPMTKMERIRRRRGGRAFALATALVSLPTLRAMRVEAHMSWLGLTRRGVARQYRGAQHLLVNVGCGPRGHHGWVNLDAYRAEGVTCVRDCRTKLALESGSARAIFSEHFVEHLDYYEQAPRFLADCRRVLEPGGTLRIIVPDGEKYLRAYARGGWDAIRRFSSLTSWDPTSEDRPSSTLREVLPFRTKMEVVNFHFRQRGEHQFSYDYETLAQLLTECGFEGVHQRPFGSSAVPGLAIDRQARAAESLVVEATAPAMIASGVQPPMPGQPAARELVLAD